MNIHERALEVAGRFKRAESDLIDIIQEIDQTKAYREKGFTSTFNYCLKYLKLSEPNTQNFITVARKSLEVPDLKKAIESDLITVSVARKITPVITNDNKDHWLSMAQSMPKQRLEKEVAKANPKALTPEKVKYVTEERLEIRLGVSEKLMEKLKRAQEILGEKNLEETLDKVLTEFVERKDPLQKAERNLHKRVPGHVLDIPFKRMPLRANLKHQVTFRDQDQCTHIDKTGQRCQERKWLQTHHIIPIHLGGQNRLENLKTLCFGHHQMQH